uniref:Inactive tyrosine-protein kinase PRAG1 n=1 Tax=Myotis lucifugus TaxID=59463 RepID=G1Q4M3_MYOLU
IHQALRLNPESLKMSACSDFVEHIWKPGSCKNCFCLRGDHQLSPTCPQPRAGGLPPPRLPPRPEHCRLEDEGVNSSPYSKPTIAVKPTMLSSDASDVCTEANMSPNASQASWSCPFTRSPFTDKAPSCPRHSPKNVTWHGYQKTNTHKKLNKIQNSIFKAHFLGERQNVLFSSDIFPCFTDLSPKNDRPKWAGQLSVWKTSGCMGPQQRWGAAGGLESRHQKLSGLGSRTTPGCAKDPGTHPSPQPPRESLPSEDDSDQRCSPSGDSEGPAQTPPHPGPRKLSLPSEAASSSDGLSCGSASSGASSPFAPHLESDYCSLVKEPVPGKQQDSGCHAVASNSEPIYAESTKRKKAVPVPSRPQGKAEQPAAGPGQGRMDREGPDAGPKVPATITIMAASPKEDHRTIYLSSPDSAVGVQWLRPSVSQDSGAGDQETLSKGSPGGSPVSPSPSPLSDLSEGSSGGSTGPQPSSRCPADPASSCRANGVANHDSAKCPPPATTASAADQRRPRYQTGAWSRQCRIEEEEEVEQNLLSQSWGGETMAKGTADPSSSSTWHHLCPTDRASGQNDKAGTGMSKSASFAFEFPKDRHGIEAFSPPPPPPKSRIFRHLLKMNKSSSDLEKVSQGSAESLSPSFRSVHVSFTTGSTDSLASDSRTGSDGGNRFDLDREGSLDNGGKRRHMYKFLYYCSTEDVSRSSPLQPPPLPQKKLVSRAASSPDGFFWTQGSPKPRAASPKLNLSHSEINVRAHEESHFGHGNRHHHAFSSEPLEKTFKGNGPAPRLAGGRSGSGSPSLQCKGMPSASSSQLSVASQASTSSNQPQLHSLLSSISSKEGTHAKLVGLYAQSLIRLGAKCEDLFMGRQKKELHFNENNWSLFKLTCNKPCCDSGDAIYYCATCSEDPGSTYAVKICKTPEPKVASYCSPAVPVHFNIQQDCGHFVASVPSSMLAAPDAPKDPAPAPPAPPPAQEQDCVVVITREVPHQTASDFVRDSVGSHRSEPEAYERRVCFLLLQLCNGLEHLKEHRVIHRDLCLENLLLVHCAPQASGVPSEKHLPRLIISNFLKAKQKPGGTANLQQKKSQARLAPEIVSASQYSKFDEFQTGILIYELLHQPNPFEVRAQLWEQDYRREDLPPLPTLSLYSPGLQQLAHLLLEADPIKRIRIGEAKRVLQCLLWGPRRELVEQRGTSEEALSSALHNWIDMKRALMMLKFAEKAVDRQRGVELEDWLCCQYLASAEPSALLQSLKLLQLL